MRLIIIILVIILFLKCNKSSRTEVIIQFLNEQVISKKDYRLYVPPPPPEADDSTYYNEKMKPDSITRNLKPLEIYIEDSIQYDSIFKLKTDFPIGFSYIKKISETSKQPIALDVSSIEVSKKITINSITFSEFMKILPSIRYNDNYDGIISFRNLFFQMMKKKHISKYIILKEN